MTRKRRIAQLRTEIAHWKRWLESAEAERDEAVASAARRGAGVVSREPLDQQRALYAADGMEYWRRWKGRVVYPNGPLPHTREMAERIRHVFGHGGANFPGASELYEAARKIEEWAEAWDAQQERMQSPVRLKSEQEDTDEQEPRSVA